MIRDGLIHEEIISGSTEFIRSVEEALQPALEWATANRPEELAKVHTDGHLVYGEETGRLWIALLEEWRAETAAQQNFVPKKRRTGRSPPLQRGASRFLVLPFRRYRPSAT